jgi:hypothetical protein
VDSSSAKRPLHVLKGMVQDHPVMDWELSASFLEKTVSIFCRGYENIRSVAVLLLLGAIVLVPNVGLAQGLYGAQTLAGVLNASSWSPLTWMSMGQVTVRPWIGAGWRHVGLNTVVNIEKRNWDDLEESGLDLSVLDLNVWVGQFGVEASLNERISGFLILDGCAQRRFKVLTPTEPDAGSENDYVMWRASDLEWWQLDLRLCYRFMAKSGIVGGLKWDHLDFRIDDPYDLDDPTDLRENSYRGDFQSKILCPYVGLQLEGQNYSSSLLFSPIAYLKLRVPFRYNDIHPAFQQEESDYTIRGNGYFLAYTLQFFVKPLTYAKVGAWLDASVMKFKGSADQDLSITESLPPPKTVSGGAHYSRYHYGLGLNGEIEF